jgi:CopG family transcriptional regulator/antitoxin EndoAI
MRVLISMPQDFLDMIDAIAETEHRSRSELIREAVRLYSRKAIARKIELGGNCSYEKS